METYSTTWTMNNDEIKIMAELLQRELHELEAIAHLHSGVAKADDNEWRRVTVRRMYNQAIRLL